MIAGACPRVFSQRLAGGQPTHKTGGVLLFVLYFRARAQQVWYKAFGNLASEPSGTCWAGEGHASALAFSVLRNFDRGALFL
jgi:hypothetical protein